MATRIGMENTNFSKMSAGRYKLANYHSDVDLKDKSFPPYLD